MKTITLALLLIGSNSWGLSVDLGGGNSTIATDAVDTDKIEADAVTTVKLINNAVDTAKLASDAVDTGKVLTDSITTPKLINSAVATAKLATDSVTSAKILNGTIASADLAAGAVDTDALGTDAVTGVKVLNGAISTAKLATDSVSEAKVLDTAISTNKLATDAVSGAKILDTAVSTNKLATDAVTSAKILNGTVATADIAAGAVTSDKTTGTSVTCTGTNYLAAQVVTNGLLTGSGACTAAPGATQWTTSGSDIYYDGGSVGINDTTPEVALTVVGTAKITQSAGKQLHITGWSRQGGATTLDGSMEIGAADNDSGLTIDHTGGNGITRFINWRNTAGCGFEFYTRAAAFAGTNGIPALDIDCTAGVVTSTNNFIIGGSADGVGNALTVAGSTLTVANTGIVSAPSQSGAHAGILTGREMASGVTTRIHFDTATFQGIMFNNNATIDIHASSDTFVARGTGFYLFQLCLNFPSWPAATGLVTISCSAGSVNAAFASTPLPAIAGSYRVCTDSAILELTNGQTVVCNASQTSGSSLAYGDASGYLNRGMLIKIW